jgi:prepilin-type N-terminal cleavage/methylation domain-containing protein
MKHKRNSGFTLLELAVGIVVLALLLGGLLIPLRTQVEVRKIDETQKMLAQAREALLGYVVANGYFPCPADDGSDGAESNGPNPHDSVNGICGASTGNGDTGFHGFLPARTLGISPVDSRGYAIDAWGRFDALPTGPNTSANPNRIRYSVYSDAATIGRSLVRSGGMAGLGIPALGGASLFNVCLSGTGVGAADCGATAPPNQVTLATNAVAVIWSVGARSVAANAHETENLNNNRVFVSRSASDVAATQFDDIVTWIPMTVVISRMVAGGQLP